MEDALTKIVEVLLGKDTSGIVAILLLIVGYLAWKLYATEKYSREAAKANAESLEKKSKEVEHLQEALTGKYGEERKALMDLLEKHHQNQIGLIQALTEIKSLVMSISIRGK